MGSRRRTPRKSGTALHKEIERRQRDDARRATSPPAVVVRENWDGSMTALRSTGKTVEITPTVGEPPEPGKHHWVVMISYDVHDLMPRYDPSKPGGDIGALGPDRVIVASPPLCSECATIYTPEEVNTRCTGEVPS